MMCWLRVILPAVFLLCVGCVDGAKLARVTETGGIVTYPLKKDRESIYSSPFRADALKLIEEHCKGSYLIVREGETQGQSTMSGVEGDDMVTTRRFWGLQFQCK